MLETMRKHSRSLIIYVLFGILIAVFVLSFGPQSGQTTAGCTPGSSYAAKVGSRTIGEHSWRYAINALSGGSQRRQPRTEAMSKLIERELFAQAAEAAGFALSDSEVEGRIAKGEVWILGQRGPAAYMVNDKFDYEILDRFAKGLGLPDVGHFVDEQRRELLAARMRTLIQASARTSADEMRARYQREHEKVWLEFVKFEPERYRTTVPVAGADLDAYVTAHGEELKQKWERDKPLYTGGGDWVRLRMILIKKSGPKPAPATQPQVSEASAPDPGRAAADELMKRIKAGEDMALIARERSQDDGSAARGGLVGWKRATGVGLGAEVQKAVEGLQAGQKSEVVEGEDGFYIVKVEERHSGDLTQEKVQADFAWPKVLEENSKARAKADAEAALAKAQAGTPLEQLFSRETEAASQPSAISGDAAAARSPKLQETGAIVRMGDSVSSQSNAKYVGRSAELVKAVFTQIQPGQVGPKVYEVEDGFVLVRVQKREQADLAELDKDKDTLAESWSSEKAHDLLNQWTLRRCQASQGDIVVNMGLLETVDPETGQRRKVSYKPCAHIGRPRLQLPAGMPDGVLENLEL